MAELATRISNRDLVAALAIACGDLAEGFAAPPDSPRRLEAHRRAWVGIRRIDRAVTEARGAHRAPAELLRRVQRAVDRADVLVGALVSN